jgi:hypothetical protein
MVSTLRITLFTTLLLTLLRWVRTDEESAAFVRMFLSRLAVEHPDLAWPICEETQH